MKPTPTATPSPGTPAAGTISLDQPVRAGFNYTTNSTVLILFSLLFLGR